MFDAFEILHGNQLLQLSTIWCKINRNYQDLVITMRNSNGGNKIYSCLTPAMSRKGSDKTSFYSE